jgi:nitric oxide reductase large subunit
MNSNRSDWYVPSDWLAILSLYFIILPMGLLSAMLIPALNNARHGNPALVYVSMTLAMVGVVLLFFARLPLYRQHKFFYFGPKALPPRQRRLYWAAYILTGMSVVLMLLLMLALK